jgi:hypothetical protein
MDLHFSMDGSVFKRFLHRAQAAARAASAAAAGDGGLAVGSTVGPTEGGSPPLQADGRPLVDPPSPSAHPPPSPPLPAPLAGFARVAAELAVDFVRLRALEPPRVVVLAGPLSGGADLAAVLAGPGYRLVAGPDVSPTAAAGSHTYVPTQVITRRVCQVIE